MSAIASTSPGALAGNRFLAAIRYLTLLPIPRPTSAAPMLTGATAACLPLMGAVIGAIGILLFSALLAILPAWLAALLVGGMWTALTGVLRESGRFLRGSPRTNLILFSILFLRWQGLLAHSFYVDAHMILAVLAIQTVPRAGLVAMAWTARPRTGMGIVAAGGTGMALSANLRSSSAIVAIALGLLAAFLAGGILLFTLAGIAGYFTIRLLCTWSYAWRGGADGDAYGFAELIFEAVMWALWIGGLF